jgi:peptidoglycan hydrolase CwlO-like protein
MDKQFTTLTSSYYDNYLQYKITGNPSYQNSYMSADQGIQSILSSLQDQINAQNQQISAFYNADVEGKLRSLQSDIRSTQRNILKESDEATAASMRATPTSFGSIPTSYYISAGSLTAIVFLLLALR